MSRISEAKITVKVEVNPTEDINKVRIAVQKVLGDIPLNIIEDKDRKYLVGKAEGIEALSKFHELLRRERILDAARKVILRSVREGTITFFLNKQVAFAGHISFSQPEGESPLGPIQIQILCDRPRELIDWLTLKTT